VGRTLEERAKLQASSDMAALQGLMPQTARLSLGHAAPGSSSSSSSSSSDWVEVPADAVGPGDVVLVLPGDRVPVDGTVVNGRSTIDESALTGEPLPLVKQQGGWRVGRCFVRARARTLGMRMGSHAAPPPPCTDAARAFRPTPIRVCVCVYMCVCTCVCVCNCVCV
jgi:hypothetical protein